MICDRIYQQQNREFADLGKSRKMPCPEFEACVRPPRGKRNVTTRDWKPEKTESEAKKRR